MNVGELVLDALRGSRFSDWRKVFNIWIIEVITTIVVFRLFFALNGLIKLGLIFLVIFE